MISIFHFQIMDGQDEIINMDEHVPKGPNDEIDLEQQQFLQENTIQDNG